MDEGEGGGGSGGTGRGGTEELRSVAGADACRAANATRAKKSIEAVSITSVHRYIKGVTHARGRVDGRGKSQNILAKAHVKKLLGVRRRIIQKAVSEDARDLCRGHSEGQPRRRVLPAGR